MDTFMKIMETLFYPMTKFLDWSVNNDVNAAVAVGGMMAISLGYVGVAATPFIMKAHFNAKAMDRTCQKLDSSPSKVFKIAASENSYNEFQKQAARAAVALNDRIGNGLVYGSEQSCADNHSLYKKHQYMTTTVTMVGRSSIVIPRQVTEFHPAIVGIQVANDNPETAVTLYSSNKKGFGYRQDGALVALDF